MRRKRRLPVLRTAIYSAAAMAGMLAIAGCGGPKEVKVDPGAGGGQPAASSPPLQAPPPNIGVPAVPSAALDVPAPKPKATPTDLVEAEPGFQWFATGGDEPQHQVVEPDPNALPPDLASIQPPSAGVDSSLFSFTAPAANGAGAGNAASSSNAKFDLPEGLTALPEFGKAEDGAPLRVRSEKDGATMAYVPAGTVKIGVRSGPSEASPELAIPLDPFYIDISEVTLAQYEAFRADLRETKKQTKPNPLNGPDEQDYPVRGITYGDARSFAGWAGKALPTEAQWEMAARSPKGFTHPWGNGKALWPKSRTLQDVTAVKLFRTDESVFGVFDLAGNVREWVFDPWSPTAFQDNQATAVSQLRNWDGPKKGAVENTRVVKGNGPGWNVWHRSGVIQTSKVADIGFRCVLSLKESKKK